MEHIKIFTNGRILAQAPLGLEGKPSFVDCMMVKGGKIVAMGQDFDMEKVGSDNTTVYDLRQRTVLPSFIDGHMHLLLLGQSLRKLDLAHCNSVEDIRYTIKQHAAANLMHRQYFAKIGVTAAMLDDIDPRPIFIDNSTLHSCWCNSAAVKVLGIENMPDPAGGRIYRDELGNPSGLLDEGAMMSIIWPYQASSSPKAERMECMAAAIEEYNKAGYTGIIEMAMDEDAWDALVALRAARPNLPIRVAAYWLIKPTIDMAANSKQVQRAIELNQLYNSHTSPDLRIVGIKLICDGIIDACTAFLSEPYASAGSPPPIWLKEYLEPVVKEADAGGLQVALHAIGDAAIRMAIDSIENNATPGRRHRIEHIELASPEDAQRLGNLGLTASIQPVHADPSILKAWPRLLGKERCERAFAYREFADAGALMAIGSDSPTSPWAPMENLYVATTRRSSRDPTYNGTVNEHFRMGICESIVAATQGASRSVFEEERTGFLSVGKLADFIVVDMDWTAEGLLKAKVEQTWFEGNKTWG